VSTPFRARPKGRTWAHSKKLAGITVAAISLALALGLSPVTSAQPPAPQDPEAVYTFRVKTSQPIKAAADLAKRGFDLVEARVGKDLLVIGDASTRAQLRRAGYRATVYNNLTAEAEAQAQEGANARFYGGYKTADEYIQTLDDTAAAYPNLAVTYDVGDSWLKTQNAALGSDMKVICITNQQPGDCQLTPNSTKPRFFLMGSIHARELTPSEVADRWIADLTTQYGVNAEITALVNSTELWVMPLANPDGREIAEPGTPTPYLQRKNANNTLGNCAVPPTATNQHGVDLNRNANFLWGGVGTSTDPCAQTYRGVSAASEPEMQALQNLMLALFPDARGPNITDAAPLTTRNMMMTMHSYGNYMLFPWGHTNTDPPNNAGLRSMAFRFSWYNGYLTGTPGEVLYTTSGTTDDYAYGTLGVAASTIEFGSSSGTCGGFTPPYSCQDAFYNTNRNLLIYAGKLAREPYTLSLGPNTHTQSVTPTSVAAGTNVTLGARAQDSAYGSSGVARPSSQRINAAQYYVDVPPWAGGTAVAMTATDGNFNSASELIRATVSTTGWTSGVHTIYMRSRDLNNNWGPVTAVTVTVS
jgi:carboxypeptidase T